MIYFDDNFVIFFHCFREENDGLSNFHIFCEYFSYIAKAVKGKSFDFIVILLYHFYGLIYADVFRLF